MAENPAQPVRPSQIANNIGIATISKPPVNPLSGDVCDKLLESFDLLDRAVRRLQLFFPNLLPEHGTASRGSLGETRRFWIWQPIPQAVWNIYHRG